MLEAVINEPPVTVDCAHTTTRLSRWSSQCKDKFLLVSHFTHTSSGGMSGGTSGGDRRLEYVALSTRYAPVVSHPRSLAFCGIIPASPVGLELLRCFTTALFKPEGRSQIETT